MTGSSLYPTPPPVRRSSSQLGHLSHSVPYAVAPVPEAALSPVQIHLKFFYYKNSFSYWGLLYTVRSTNPNGTTDEFINASSVIHTRSKTPNVSFYHPRKFLQAPFQSIHLLANYCSAFYHHRLFLQVLEPHMNGTIWCVLFYIKLLSLGIIFLRFSHAKHVLCFASSFLSVVEWKSIAWICHISFSHFPINEQLFSIQFGDILNKTAVDVFVLFFLSIHMF